MCLGHCDSRGCGTDSYGLAMLAGAAIHGEGQQIQELSPLPHSLSPVSLSSFLSLSFT